MSFQAIDYAALKPVRYAQLSYSIFGMCVRESWLAVTDYNRVRLYSLPQLQLLSYVPIPRCHNPCCDRNGMLYVPGHYNIKVLEISDSGNMSVVRTLTAGRQYMIWPRVASHPQPGLVFVADNQGHNAPELYVINVADDSVVETLEIPDPCYWLLSLSSLPTGEILISYRVSPVNSSIAL